MKRILLAVSLIPLLLVLPVLFISKAQTDDPDLLLYDGYPDVYPIQFQALAPGETPRQSNFTSRLPLQFNSDAAIIYVILQNTGWSQGYIGFGSDVFDFEKQYVALEVEPGEDGLYTPLADGLAFELNPVEGVNFHLPILISQRHIFAVYQIVETGGTAFSGYTNIADRRGVTAHPVEYRIDSKPVLGAFVLDCHIVARVSTPTPIPATPIPTTAYQPDTNPGPVEPSHPISTAIPGITITPPTLSQATFTPSYTPPPR